MEEISEQQMGKCLVIGYTESKGSDEKCFRIVPLGTVELNPNGRLAIRSLGDFLKDSASKNRFWIGPDGYFYTNNERVAKDVTHCYT
jgi:hypothetical protein